MARSTYVVLTNPVEGQDEAYNHWYDTQHLADVLGIPGIVSARRLRACNKRGVAGCHYLALYEVESDDPRATIAQLRDAGLEISDALDRSSVSAVLFEPIGETASDSNAT